MTWRLSSSSSPSPPSFLLLLLLLMFCFHRLSFWKYKQSRNNSESVVLAAHSLILNAVSGVCEWSVRVTLTTAFQTFIRHHFLITKGKVKAKTLFREEFQGFLLRGLIKMEGRMEASNLLLVRAEEGEVKHSSGSKVYVTPTLCLSLLHYTPNKWPGIIVFLVWF